VAILPRAKFAAKLLTARMLRSAQGKEYFPGLLEGGSLSTVHTCDNGGNSAILCK